MILNWPVVADGCPGAVIEYVAMPSRAGPDPHVPENTLPETESVTVSDVENPEDVT